jgi:hypothetical protein
MTWGYICHPTPTSVIPAKAGISLFSTRKNEGAKVFLLSLRGADRRGNVVAVLDRSAPLRSLAMTGFNREGTRIGTNVLKHKGRKV